MSAPDHSRRPDKPTSQALHSFWPSLTAVGFRVGVLLLTYLIFEWWILGVAQLPEAGYHRASIILEVAKSMVVPNDATVSSILRLVILVPLILFAVRSFRRLSCPWTDLDEGRTIRIMVCALAWILAWAYSTYDRNL